MLDNLLVPHNQQIMLKILYIKPISSYKNTFCNGLNKTSNYFKLSTVLAVQSDCLEATSADSAFVTVGRVCSVLIQS